MFVDEDGSDKLRRTKCRSRVGVVLCHINDQKGHAHDNFIHMPFSFVLSTFYQYLQAKNTCEKMYEWEPVTMREYRDDITFAKRGQPRSPRRKYKIG